MTDATRQQASRQARTRAGGKLVSIVLPADAAVALARLLKAGYSPTTNGCISAALKSAARYCDV